MKRIKGVHVWFVLSVSAALAVPPLLLRASPHGFDSCARRVEAMPQPERDRIDRNFREFLAMDEAERNHYRNMHNRLEQDVEEGQGVYAAEFQNYTAWLRTIPPYRREELKHTTDSGKRLELMRQIVEEEAERETREQFFRIPGLRRFAFRNRRPLLLEPEQYQAMMAEVERSVDLTPSQKNELAGLSGLEHTFRLFEFLSEGTPLNRALSQAEVHRIIQKAGIESLVETVEAREPAEPGESDGPREPFAERDPERGVLMAVIFTNVGKEYEIEVHERSRPSEDDLRKFLNDLDVQDRDRLLRLEPDEFNRQLHERYAADRGDLDIRVVFRGMFGGEGEGRPPFRSPGGRPGPEGRGEFPRPERRE